MKLKELLDQYGEWEWVSTQVPENGEADVAMIQIKKPKPKTVWDLKNGDSHVWIDSFGDIEVDCMIWEEGDNCNRQARAIGNIFLTKEEAEKDVERRKVEALLLKHGGRRWFKEDTPNYFIRVYENGGWLTSDWTNHSPIQGTIYFDTEKQAKKAVKEIGEERIQKALFEVR